MNSPGQNSRTRILRAASTAPGIHLRELARSLALSLHSVRYHVESLSRSGLIICERNGRYSRIFPAGTTKNDIVIYSSLRNNAARKILSTLCSSSSKLTNKEICEKSGLAKSTVSETIHNLVEDRLLQFYLSDAGIRIGLVDSDQVARLLQETREEMDLSIVDNFIGLWDF